MLRECLVCSSMRLGVPFIAPRQLGAVESIQEGNSCLLSTGAPDSLVHHQTLSGADFFPVLAQPTVGDLESLTHRTLSRAHRTVWCPLQIIGPATRHARIARPTVGSADRWLGRPLAHRTVRCTTGQSGAPQDSPVSYSRTPSPTSREQPFHQSQTGAPDTVRCTQTEQPFGCTQPTSP
jgi:hypothetical protein